MFDKAYQRCNDRRLRVYFSLGMFRNVYKHSQTSKLLLNSCSQEETEVQKLRILKKVSTINIPLNFHWNFERGNMQHLF